MMSTAASTASRLCIGSPMPMKTTLVIPPHVAPAPSAASSRRAATTCSTICAVHKFALHSMQRNCQLKSTSWKVTMAAEAH